MWQGILTYKDCDEGGLTITMERAIGMPGRDRSAAKREALEYLKQARNEGPGSAALGICIRHSAYEPGGGRTLLKELVFK